ncbi:MAG: hypothetical protein QXV17_11580 [Candidatus Micrarchaeaceae archaeon]
MKKLGEGRYTDYTFSRAVWQGINLGDEVVNYIVVREPRAESYTRYYHSERVRKNEVVINVVDRKIRIMEKGRDIPVARIVYNRESGEMTVNIITNLGHQYLYYVFKELFNNLKDFVPKNSKGVRWGFSDVLHIWKDRFVTKIDLYGGVKGARKYTCVYLFRGENIIYLDDIDKNEENYIKTSSKYSELQNKYFNRFKNKIKKKYELSDILSYGGLKAEGGEFHARIVRDERGGQVLKYPFEAELVVTEQGYDLAGSIIWKCVALDKDYPYIRQVFLIGKEYTGYWWLHTVPPDYWDKSLAECERWLLNLGDDDVVVSEA